MERSKYNVSQDTDKRTFEGIVFDSAVEMRFYRDAILPGLGSGTIKYSERQKPYVLQPKFKRNGKNVQEIKYVADFYLEFPDGSSMVIDIKGMPDAVAKIKRKLFWFKYPETDYRWVCWSKNDGGWCDYEDVVQHRRARKKARAEKEKQDERI